MSIVDHRDGSAYELWVLSAEKILLLPQLRATYASINRLVNQILNNFKDGVVADHEG
jgi:hypothetical protein